MSDPTSQTNPTALTSRIASLARLVPGYDGYADAKRRRDTDRALRQALAGRVRAIRDTLGATGRQLGAAGRFGELPPIEALHGRLDRLIDRLQATAPRFAGWFGEKRLPDEARAALVALDHGLWVHALDLDAAARALIPSDPHLPDTVAGLATLVAALQADCDARAATLTTAAPPVPTPPRSPLDTLMVGDTVTLLGENHTVVGRAQWERGDQALLLGDAAGGLRLWQDPAGGLVLFEAQAIAVALPPPEPVTLESETFRLAWADEGRGLLRDATGGRRIDTPRWLLAGDGGGRLWVEAVPAGARVWRGLPVDASELTVI
jgi:hypothetical protein